MAPQCPDMSDPNNGWSYCPSLAASIIFTILFFLISSAHIVQAIIYKKAFLWVLTMGCVWEFSGFVCRTLAIYNTTSSALYIAQFLLILIAPLWINAFCYMLLGRMVHFWLPSQKIFLLKAQKMGNVFVCLDIACFIIQVAGGVMTTGTDMSQSQLTTGLHLYTAGVALQLLVLLIFFALVFTFQFRIRREAPGTVSASRFLTAVLTSVMLLIVYRTVYRLIEFSAPKDSSLANTIKYNEWYMYVFDSLPMWVAAGLFSVFHPGRWLVGEKSEFQKKTRAQKREEKRIGKAEKAQKKEAIEIRMGERRTADDGSDIV